MGKRKAKIFYVAMDDFWRKEKKLEWLRENPISKIAFESITPDEKHNWINQTDNDWDSLIPIVDKEVKSGKKEEAIFKLFSLGPVTAKDEWSLDFDETNLSRKSKFLVDHYEQSRREPRTESEDSVIKWTSELEDYLRANHSLSHDPAKIRPSHFRPFVKKYLYFDRIFTHRTYQNEDIFGIDTPLPNNVIAFLGMASSHELAVLASARIIDAGFLKQGNGITQCLPQFRYDSDDKRHDNITDWAVEEFARRGARGLTKEDIFHYVYAVLHYPPYREKYEQNLKREFPRIPVYENALEWARLGKELMELHLNYETVEPYALVEKHAAADLPPRQPKRLPPLLFKEGSLENPVATAPGSDPFIPKPTPKLRADKVAGVIEIDTHTSLEGVPAIAWEYKLGNRSALEWILDQYKERKPKDPTIAEKFNTYKFEDYKEHVIDLLKRVCTVSVKSMEIINSMPDTEA